MPDKKVWSYIRQDVTYVAGGIYSVSCDVKLLGTPTKTSGVSANLGCNVVYKGVDGSSDHVVTYKEFTTGGWDTWEFEFTIPASTTEHVNEQFSIYGNPVGSEGVCYMVSDIEIRQK